VVVNTGLVSEEISVDAEGHFNGAVGHDFRLNLLNIGGDGVRRLALILGVLEQLLVAVGGGLHGAAGRLGAVDVVLARGEGVGVNSLRDEASLVPEVPSGRGVAALAAVAAGVAAADHVLGGELELVGLSGGNANTVRHGLDGAESPARAARTLVADVADGVALGPSSAGIERVRDSFGGLDVLNGREVSLGVSGDSHEALGFLHGHTIKAGVPAGNPADIIARVDLVDQVLGHDGGIVKERDRCGNGDARQ
jgi:hypothetical protein